jgi:hypothetical protein
MNIDKMYNAFVETFAESTGFQPMFKSDGGSHAEDLSLQK